MTASPLLILALASAALGAPDPEACRGAYLPEYAGTWDLKRSDWDEACGRRLEPEQVLKAGQLAFVRACAAELAKAVADGRTNQGTVDSFCAQGAPGRRHLLGLYKPEALAAGRPPPAAARAGPAPSPGEGGMGPLARALEYAKREWDSSVCLNEIRYAFQPVQLTRMENYLKPERYTGYYQGYHYVLYRRSTDGEPRVLYADQIDGSCIPGERLAGPQTDYGYEPANKDCLTKTATDLQAATGLARAAGVETNRGGLFANLLSARKWAGRLSECKPPECKAPSKRQQRSMQDKEVWIISASGKTAVIDAAAGRVLFAIDDPMSYVIRLSPWEHVPSTCLDLRLQPN